MQYINLDGTEEDWENYFILRQIEIENKLLKSPVESQANPNNKKSNKKYSILEKSKKHLKDSNMSYFYHLRHSISNGNKLIFYALSSYAHAILPGKLKQHAARGIISMYEDMKRWPHLRKAMYEISLRNKTTISE